MPTRSALVALLVAAPFAAAADPPTAASAARQVKEVIGHRGSAADRPENTLAGVRRAAEVGAHLAEIDVRTTKDGALVCLHDPELSRTTDGKGPVGTVTLAEVKKLDAGAKFADAKYRGERVPTLREVLEAGKGKIGVMLDLKETGDDYARKVAAEVTAFGEPKRAVVGVRSVEQAKLFRKLLPDARQIGLVPTQADIEPFADAGVTVVRLWPKWLADEGLVPRVKKRGLGILVGAGDGSLAEVRPVLACEPVIVSSDDPGKLLKSLAEIAGKK